MVTAYLPGSSLSFGKLYWPWALLTTETVMVEPVRLALTITPSIAPSSAEATLPVSAEGEEFCAAAGPANIQAARAVVIRSDTRGLRMGLVMVNPLSS